jgi:hypothetical protein
LRQGERFSQRHLEFDHTGYQLHGSAHHIRLRRGRRYESHGFLLLIAFPVRIPALTGLASRNWGANPIQGRDRIIWQVELG